PANVFFGSDYFEKSYELAVKLIRKGLAYVCDLSQEEMSKYRGTLTEPGTPSPYRNRSIEENLRLFTEMRQGKYADGERTLRAKIDMSSPNINMRDPVIYRIIHITHHNTGDKWCIYPMYDFAHPLQDAFEGITDSLCSLEYVDHRPLYDWFIEKCETEHVPHQYEFGRLNITNTIMSKRYLKQLVEAKVVKGYDDPRMPTLAGLRRRGYSPEAIRNFILGTGLSRINSTVSSEMLENSLRNDLLGKTKRMNAIIDPLKVTITNYESSEVELINVICNPDNEQLGERTIYFGKHLYIEKADFLPKAPNKQWRRLSLGLEVRLMFGYFIKCHNIIYDDQGEVLEIECSYDPKTKSGSGFNERKPNGTIHFVEASTAVKARFNLFDSLLVDDDSDRPLLERLNPFSWEIKEGFIEPELKKAEQGERFQFIRNGYYFVDYDSTPTMPIFNRIVELKSSFK
ncbi:MAG: glutamine--tRNA ligase, partial [Acholeplasmataceae bacterium]|nr:glutamine--tRNA ligase [Acholeplasmataceae bacterium]